jgi:hypothetical protein
MGSWRDRDRDSQPWVHPEQESYYASLRDPRTGEKADLTAKPVDAIAWCGECDPLGAEHWSNRWVYDDAGRATKCPRCHPFSGPTGPLVKIHKKHLTRDHILAGDQLYRKLGEVRSQIVKKKREAEDG